MEKGTNGNGFNFYSRLETTNTENRYNLYKAIKEVIPIVKKELMKVMIEQMKINDEANLNTEKEIEQMKKDIKKIEKE